MPTIWVPDEVFAQYLMDEGGDTEAAKSSMVDAVKDQAPEQ